MKKLLTLLTVVGISVYLVGCGQQAEETPPAGNGGPPALGNGTTAPDETEGAADPLGEPGGQPGDVEGAPEGTAPEGDTEGAAPEADAEGQPESAEQPEKSGSPDQPEGEQDDQ